MYRRTFYSLFLTLLIISCKPTEELQLQTFFYVYRFNPPALVEFSKGFQQIREIPFSVPISCGLLNLFPAPVGEFIAIELSELPEWANGSVPGYEFCFHVPACHRV
jgi:hypothetical protein